MADLIDRDVAYKTLCKERDMQKEIFNTNHNIERRGIMQGFMYACEIIRKQNSVNRWIPVEDALPDALQNVLVCTDINTVTIAWINGDGWTFADTGNGHTENWSFADVKYWMNLPEPPEKE